MKWIKASERLPKKRGSIHAARIVLDFHKGDIGFYDELLVLKDGKILILDEKFEPDSPLLKDYEWLDESPEPEENIVKGACDSTLKKLATTTFSTSTEPEEELVIKAYKEVAEHKCQYCGAMTTQPDELCLNNPKFRKLYQGQKLTFPEPNNVDNAKDAAERYAYQTAEHQQCDLWYMQRDAFIAGADWTINQLFLQSKNKEK